MPKQDMGKPLSDPVLERTGDAKQSQPFQIYSKNLFSNSGLYNLRATVLATR
jgi:hypothetical protein